MIDELRANASRLIAEIWRTLYAPSLFGRHYFYDDENGVPRIASAYEKWFRAWFERFHDCCCIVSNTTDADSVRECVEELKQCLRELRRYRAVQSVKDFLKI